MISLILPWPPSANDIYKRNRYGGVRLSDRVRQFREEVMLAWSQAKAGGATGLGKSRLAMTLRLHPPDDKRGHDISNIVKALEDALQGSGVFVNDEQIDRLEVERMARHGAGRVVVSLTTASPGEQ